MYVDYIMLASHCPMCISHAEDGGGGEGEEVGKGDVVS